jgi:hypothetical protein
VDADLRAVVEDAPLAFSPAAARGPFTACPCELSPLHLAAALGREGCLRVLLEAGEAPVETFLVSLSAAFVSHALRVCKSGVSQLLPCGVHSCAR